MGFMNFMLAGKKFTDFTSLFSPHDFKKNDDIILDLFLNAILLNQSTKQTELTKPKFD